MRNIYAVGMSSPGNPRVTVQPRPGTPGVAHAGLSGAKTTFNIDEWRDVVVLSADMRGFTRNAALLPATTVLTLLDAFFTRMAAVIEDNGGTLLALHGDSLLAAFGVPVPQADTARRAIKTARQMQASHQELADQWITGYGLQTALGIGINRGEAVVGVVGAPQHQTYMVFGECVSMAERFMHRARAGEYVYSAAIHQELSAAGYELAAATLPQLEIAGREPVPLYGVVLDTRLDFT